MGKQQTNPLVECACGCGEQLLRLDNRGRPRRFVSGHHRRVPTYEPKASEGFCMCGCGKKTKRHRANCATRGWVKGAHQKFIVGHAQRGRKHTMAQRLKASIRGKRDGRRIPLTEAVRKKMSDAAKARPKHLHPRWKGGVTPERQSRRMREWSSAVKDRDGQRCQICGTTSRLHAHHLWSFAEFPNRRYDIDNGVTLCADCHYKRPVHRTPTSLSDIMFADITSSLSD